MTDYITFNITNGKVIKIKCADTGCPAEYTREDIRKFGSKEIYEKYLKFKENIDISTNPSHKWCPRPDCNRFVTKGRRGNRVDCECGYEMCFKCGQGWHSGKCNANVDSDFYGWAAGIGNIGNCPKCKARVEKIAGCNHMTCGSC
jgi:E3 ubiquitin-protein ligase RNF19A